MTIKIELQRQLFLYNNLMTIQDFKAKVI